MKIHPVGAAIRRQRRRQRSIAMKPTIITFNLNEARLSRLRFLCMKLGVVVRPVPAEAWGQPISALCGLSAPGEIVQAEAFPEEMLVFCHMDNTLVNRFLTTCRQMRFAPVALKAILTPTNAAWTPVQLCAELRQERAAVMQGEAADHQEV